MHSWAEQMKLDIGLRTFVEAEIARAHVDLCALRAENERLRTMNQALDQKVKSLERKGRAA
jgi:cell division protein FtsB